MNSEPKSLLPRHRGIMRSLIKGMTVPEIASTHGMNECVVKRVISSELFQDELAKLQREADEAVIKEQVNVKAKITELTQFSLEQLENMLKSAATNDRLKADICWDFLDRDGYKPVERREVENTHTVYLESMQAAFEERKAKRKAIEAETNTELVATDLFPDA